MRTALVTGATGFIAGHLIEELLRHGYSVRGSVRHLEAHADRVHLEQLAAQLGANLEFVAADLTADEGWSTAVQGCDSVFHTASPIPLKHPELVETACAGMRRVVTAAAESSTVRRLIVTSSTEAISQGHNDRRLWTASDWSVVERCHPYAAGKTIAEKWAWDYVSALPETRGMEMVSILPGMVLGPVHRAATSTSHEPISRLMNRSLPGTIRVGWATVDVRDLAVAHRLALETPDAANNRYICAGPPVWMHQVADILHNHYQSQGWRIPTREIPDFAVRLAGIVDRGIRLVLPDLGHVTEVDSSQTTRDLHWVTRPVPETIIDTADSLIAHGIVGRQRDTSARSRGGDRPSTLGR
ncbi:NAD-dependent epimerase/dehydratase family protein [Nocardia noduli]|uniref:NAD-dependent epimerase/dehydratase family protein n=1 Tax=Nocardia noduli TaxID=2815722 RepID=UPI001C23E539|nr:NAD-dependent epimerase/dehydratase family protein [Nocardia noduli]